MESITDEMQTETISANEISSTDSMQTDLAASNSLQTADSANSFLVDGSTACASSSNSLMSQMLGRVAESSAHFKHQQRGDPDLTHAEKYQIASDILQKNPATFLARFGKFLIQEDLQCFEEHRGDYMIDFHLKDIQKHLDNKVNKVKVKNRRYEAMKELMEKGDYFSEDEMKWRNPLLYEQMVGQHLTDDDIQAKIDKSDVSFSNILLNHITVQQTNDLYLHQKDKEDGQMEEEEDSDDTEDEESELEDEDDGLSEAERVKLKAEFLRIMQESFLDGRDAEFNYSEVDGNEQYDSLDMRARDEEEKYFDEDSED